MLSVGSEFELPLFAYPRSDLCGFFRSLFWFLFALGAVILIAIILFLPETLRSIVGNGSIPARGINLSLLSIWQERRRSRSSFNDDEISIVSADKPPKKTWKDVKPFAPLKMFREKDVLAILTFNSATYSLFYATTASTGTVFKAVYGLNESELGLCYIANGVGCLMATFVNGPRMTADYKYVERRMEEKKKEAMAEDTIDTMVEGKKKDLNDLSSFPIEQARFRSLRELHFSLSAVVACADLLFPETQLTISQP